MTLRPASLQHVCVLMSQNSQGIRSSACYCCRDSQSITFAAFWSGGKTG